jgi:hypothetical protein
MKTTESVNFFSLFVYVMCSLLLQIAPSDVFLFRIYVFSFFMYLVLCESVSYYCVLMKVRFSNPSRLSYL